MAGTYTHQALMDTAPDCPESTGARPQVREAHHFVHDPVTNPRNFLPARIKTPRRGLRGEQACKGCGLSMFDTADQARSFYESLKKMNQHRALGTHLAFTQLSLADGVSTRSAPNGHFTLFEYNIFLPAQRFSLIGPL